MAQKRKGLFARMIEGPEITEERARAMLPGNRWELGWDLFKTNFSKMILLNLLFVVFALLAIIVIVVKPLLFVPYFAQTTPFSQNLGIGYPTFTATVGLAEQVELFSNVAYLALPIVSLVASVGISGGMHVMRNFVWGEGVILKSDFWTGVKKNYGQVALSTLLYTLVLALGIMSVSYCNYYVALDDSAWLMKASSVITTVILIVVSVVYLHMISMCVTYKVKFFKLIKNAFLMTIGLLPHNAFFVLLAIVPFLLLSLNVPIIVALVFAVIAMFGFSYFMLVWTNYCQWIYDKFLNDKVPGAKKNRAIYKQPQQESYGYKKSRLRAKHVKPITDTEVEIVELPQSFSRADLARLEESKKAMREDSDLYKKHKPQEQKQEETPSQGEENKNGKQ